MAEEKKPLQVKFAPGCFDDFEGSQEELDELMKMILEMAESGELIENSTPLDIDELDDKDLAMISKSIIGPKNVH